MSGVETVAGTSISISPTKPATFNAAGYAAISDWAEIGEITDGGAHGRTYNEVTHNPIKTRGTRKFKGSFNEGTKTLQVGMDRADPGQAVLDVALKSDADYSFKVVYQGGDIDYFQAKVLSFEKSATSVDSIRSASVNLSLTTNKDGVGIIEVSADEVEFTLTYSANANGSILGDSPQTVPMLGSGTPVAAVPDTGYVFVKWSDDRTDNPRIDTGVTSNKTLSATFGAE
jgi:uncharacterized repeat protein (TIGR02543 family)